MQQSAAKRPNKMSLAFKPRTLSQFTNTRLFVFTYYTYAAKATHPTYAGNASTVLGSTESRPPASAATSSPRLAVLNVKGSYTFYL